MRPGLAKALQIELMDGEVLCGRVELGIEVECFLECPVPLLSLSSTREGESKQMECLQVVGRVLHLVDKNLDKNTDSGWTLMMFGVVDRTVPPRWPTLSDMDRRRKDQVEDERSC
jgi:hypothetical protein